jgi:ketosteroid isomerase-like protein
MTHHLARVVTVIVLIANTVPAYGQQSSAGNADWKASLLAAREAVWRDYFGNPDKLAATLTDDFIAIDNGGGQWSNKAETVASSRASIANGVKLESLRFPETRIQRYGDVAIIYTTYEMILAANGKQGPMISGRATEIFRWDGSRWFHPGWHLDSGK